MHKFRFRPGLLIALGLLLAPYLTLAQSSSRSSAKARTEKAGEATTGALLWEVSGAGLKQPSYLFGTFHLLNSDFLRAHPAVLDRFRHAKAVVGELVFDSTVMVKIAAATALQGTTLDQLLKPEDFERVDARLQQLSPYKLRMLNGLAPMAVVTLLTTLAWQQQHPEAAGAATPMDLFFQQEAKAAGKAVIGLETAEEQADLLFHRLPLARQAELLVETVRQPTALTKDLDQLSDCYRTQDLACVGRLLYDEKTYRPDEMDLLVAARTRAWVAPLRQQMVTQPTFVAVGAGHLVGKDGLIELLRKAGYIVKAVPM